MTVGLIDYENRANCLSRYMYAFSVLFDDLTSGRVEKQCWRSWSGEAEKIQKGSGQRIERLISNSSELPIVGVPQTFTVSLSVGGNFDGSFASELFGFQFSPTCNPFVAPGCPTDIHFTLVSVDLPEPSGWSLLSIGAMFFLAVSMIDRTQSWLVER